MSHMTYGLSAEAQNFNWLLGRFASETAGVTEAIAVSSDGLLMAMSAGEDRAGADRLSAISSGSVLGVIAGKTANLGNIAYEMTLFANRAGVALTPQLINELKNSLDT